jgi:hypothetical protein
VGRGQEASIRRDMSETKEDIYVVTSLGEVLFAAKTKRLADRIMQMLEDCKQVPETHGMGAVKTKLYSPAKLKPQQLEGLRKAFHNETKS